MAGVVLIVGAASGIGRETAFIYAERGADVVVFTDINDAGAAVASSESKTFATNPAYKTTSYKIDVANHTLVQEVVDKVVTEFGRIDSFVNSAGIEAQAGRNIVESDIDEFERLHNVNSKGNFICTSIVSAAMLKQDERFVEGRSGRRSIGRGAIVNFSSIAGQIAIPTHVPYVASKWASIGITKTAAKELGGSGIRVNAICPSFADTPMMHRDISRNPSTVYIIENLSPLKRMANVEEVASVAYFLNSADASYINGVDWTVDAGMTLMCLT